MQHHQHQLMQSSAKRILLHVARSILKFSSFAYLEPLFKGDTQSIALELAKETTGKKNNLFGRHPSFVTLALWCLVYISSTLNIPPAIIPHASQYKFKCRKDEEENGEKQNKLN